MVRLNRRLGRNVFWSMLLFAAILSCLFNGIARCQDVAAESLAKSLMRDADVFRAAGDLDKAREVYRRVLADWPESDEAIPTEVELIVLDIKARDYSGIDTFLSRHSGEDISHPIFKLACECTYNGNDVKAVSLFRYFLEKWPDNEEAMLVRKELISADLRKGATADIDTRVANFLSTYAGHRFLPDAVYTLGNDCKNVNADNAAYSLYNYVINNWPNSVNAMRARHRFIIADIDNNNFANLDADIDAFVNDYFEFDQDLPTSMEVLAACCANNGLNNKADELYSYIAQTWPESEQAMRARHRIFKADIDNKNFANLDAYIDEFLAAHATDKDFVDRVLFICNLLIRKNDPAMALPYINRALEVTTELKQSIMLLKVKAECYIDMGANEQAQAVQQEIAQYAEQEYYPGVQLAIADRYRKNGEYEKAIEVYEKVLDSTTDKTQQIYAYAGIGMSSVWQGDDPNATAALEIICEDFADNEKLGWAIFVIGEEYYFKAQKTHRASGLDKAMEDYREAIAVWAKNIEMKVDKRHFSESYYFTAFTHKEIGEFEVAIDLFQTLLDKTPNFDRAWNAQFMIADCWDRMYRNKEISATDAKAQVIEACSILNELYPDSLASFAAKLMVEKYNKIK